MPSSSGRGDFLAPSSSGHAARSAAGPVPSVAGSGEDGCGCRAWVVSESASGFGPVVAAFSSIVRKPSRPGDEETEATGRSGGGAGSARSWVTATSEGPEGAFPPAPLPASSPSGVGLSTAAVAPSDSALWRCSLGGSSAAKLDEKRRACRRTGVMMKSETKEGIAKHRLGQGCCRLLSSAVVCRRLSSVVCVSGEVGPGRREKRLAERQQTQDMRFGDVL